MRTVLVGLLGVALTACPAGDEVEPSASPSTPTPSASPEASESPLSDALWEPAPLIEDDGTVRMVASVRNLDIRIHDIGSGRTQRIAPPPAESGFYDLALLETRYVYATRATGSRWGSSEIIERSYDGDTGPNVLTDMRCCAQLEAAPDGRSFVFTRSKHVGDGIFEWTVLLSEPDRAELEITRLRGLVPGRDSAWTDEITLEFSPDGRHLLVAHSYGSNPNVATRPPSLRVIRYDGKLVASLPVTENLVQPRWISNDEIVVPVEAYRVRETHLLKLGARETSMLDRSEAWTHGTLSPDGALFAYDLNPGADTVVERRSAVVVVDAATREEVARLPGYFVPSFIADDRLIVSEQDRCYRDERKAAGDCYFNYEMGPVFDWDLSSDEVTRTEFPRLQVVPQAHEILWQVSG